MTSVISLRSGVTSTGYIWLVRCNVSLMFMRQTTIEILTEPQCCVPTYTTIWTWLCKTEDCGFTMKLVILRASCAIINGLVRSKNAFPKERGAFLLYEAPFYTPPPSPWQIDEVIHVTSCRERAALVRWKDLSCDASLTTVVSHLSGDGLDEMEWIKTTQSLPQKAVMPGWLYNIRNQSSLLPVTYASVLAASVPGDYSDATPGR